MNSQGELGQVIEFAWRIHDANEAWIARADSKAGLLLPTQLGIATAILALGSHEYSQSPNAALKVAVAVSILLIAAGVGCSVAAVIPRGGASKPRPTDVIYFGDLHSRTVEELQSQLREMSDLDRLDALANQLSNIASINVRKHRGLRAAVWLTVVGSIIATSALGLAAWV